MTEPRYTEEQFAEILRRATEMQARLPARASRPEGSEVGTSTGLSLSEIRHIAGEVGIDPDLVTRAAALVSDGVHVKGGRRDRWVLTTSSAGSLTDEDKIRVARAIRDAEGAHGEADMAGAGMEWRSTAGELTRLLVTLEPLDGQTELRVSVDANPAAVLSHVFPTLGGLLIGLMVGAITEPALGAGLAIVGASAGSGLAAGHLLWNRLRANAMERSRRVLAAATAVLPLPLPPGSDRP
jgi:hypothetical protein